MQVSTFDDVSKMEDGQQIMAFRGRIKAVFKPNSGKNDKGEWQVQNLFVAESMAEGASEIRVAVWNDDEIPKTARGKEIVLCSVKNAKGQWSGLKCEHYEGKPRIRVSGAEITIGQDGAPTDEQPSAATSKQPSEQPPQTAASGSPSAPARKAESSTDDVRGFCIGAAKHVGKLGNAMKICIARAVEIGHWHQSFTGRPYPADGIQALATTLFIQGTRDGVFDRLPNDRDIAEILPSLSAGRGAGAE